MSKPPQFDNNIS